MARSPQRGSRPESFVDVEFATPARDENEGHQSEVNNGGAVGARHGSLLEGMYGVESRENMPRKRVKMVDPLAEEQQQQLNKRMHFSMAGDTGLGEWMKKDRGESKSSTSTPVPPMANIVDLTLGMREPPVSLSLSLPTSANP